MKQHLAHLWIGLATAAFLFGSSFLLYFSMSYMGERDANVEKIILENFQFTIIRFALKLLLLYLAAGGVFALFSSLLGLKRKLAVFGWQLFVWFCFWVRGIQLMPQLYTEQLFKRGGFLRGFQVFATDVLPLWAIYGLFLGVLGWLVWQKKRFWQGGLVVLLCLAWIYPLRPFAGKAVAASQPNVLVLATDSLRPDRLSYNGYNRATPHLDWFLSQGANFTRARSSLARTYSSFTSILTSQFPPDHGIRQMFPRPEQVQKRWPTLVDVFNRNGYLTGVVSDFAGDNFRRVDYGFQTVKAPHLTLPELIKLRLIEIHYFLLSLLASPYSRDVLPEMWLMPLNIDPYYATQASKRFIRRAGASNRPFFLLYFTSNSHFPYGSPTPYYRLYARKDYRGEHKYRKLDMLKQYSGYDAAAADKEQLQALYDGGVKLFDDQAGEIWRFVQDCGLAANTIVLILSDHGESLYENGYGTGHGDHLRGPYSNALTFAVYSPFESFAGRRIAASVRDIDIAPTLLDLLQWPMPVTFKGQSLLPALRGKSQADLPCYLETGIWYSRETPYIKNRVRIDYPIVQKMLELVPENGEIILKREYEQPVLAAKYRGVELGPRKYTYLPGPGNSFQEEYYFNEQLVDPASDPQLPALKQQLLALFPGRYSYDGTGRLLERYSP